MQKVVKPVAVGPIITVTYDDRSKSTAFVAEYGGMFRWATRFFGGRRPLREAIHNWNTNRQIFVQSPVTDEGYVVRDSLAKVVLDEVAV